MGAIAYSLDSITPFSPSSPKGHRRVEDDAPSDLTAPLRRDPHNAGNPAQLNAEQDHEHVHATSERSGSTILSSHAESDAYPKRCRPSEQHASLWSDSSTADKPVRRRIKPATFHDGSGRVIDAGISKPLRQDSTSSCTSCWICAFQTGPMPRVLVARLEWDIVADDLEHRHSLRQITYET